MRMLRKGNCDGVFSGEGKKKGSSISHVSLPATKTVSHGTADGRPRVHDPTVCKNAFHVAISSVTPDMVG